MSVSTTEARETYNGDGVSVNFATPYFLANADLKVYVDGVLKTITTDYSVSGAGVTSGGTVTMLSAPVSGTGNVVIIREPDQLQSSQLPSNDPFPSKTVETMIDKLTMLVQRLFDKTARTLSLSDSDSSSVSLTLPAASALKFFRWNASANAIENVDISTLSAVALPIPVAQGGTGATTAAAARASLGVLSSSENQTQIATRFTAGGTADAITGTLSPAIASYTAGLRVTTTPGGANTVTGPTLNLNSLGTKTIKKRSSTGSKVALVAGDYNASGPFDLEYDGTDFILLNPVASSATSVQLQPISASVSANALTISASALSLDFRSTTLGSGAVTTVSGTPSNLVISSGSTLGTVNAQQSRIAVLAINNAGTIELAAVNVAGGNDLSETGVISTTAEGGAGAADSASTIYSTTARTNVAYRVIGYVESTQATAGTWATSPSTIQGAGGQVRISGASMVRLNTANGYGSTNTKIRRFTNTVTNTGSDITYADSAANGASFTINTPGVYAISYSDIFNAQAANGISLNSSQLTTAIQSITVADRLCVADTGGSSFSATVATTIYLSAGAVVRAHTNGAADSVPALAQFTITRVA